jgi:hypothetical protein
LIDCREKYFHIEPKCKHIEPKSKSNAIAAARSSTFARARCILQIFRAAPIIDSPFAYLDMRKWVIDGIHRG